MKKKYTMKKRSIKEWYDAMTARGMHVYKTSYTRGYVSRRIDPATYLDDPIIHHTRDGQSYILAPSWTTTRYCVRLYF